MNNHNRYVSVVHMHDHAGFSLLLLINKEACKDVSYLNHYTDTLANAAIHVITHTSSGSVEILEPV